MLNQRAPHAGESYLSHSNSPHGDVATPPPTHTRGRAIIFELHGRSRQVSDEQYYIDNQNSLGTKPMSPVATRFLEICTRQNTFDQILGEIDTSGANSDGLLFQSIQTKYKELKRDMQIQPPNSRSRFRFWGLSGYFSLMKPTGVAFVKVRSFSVFGLVLEVAPKEKKKKNPDIISYQSKEYDILIAVRSCTLLI